MARSKITEKEVADTLLENAHVLVTQPEEDADGNEVESLRRVPLDVFFSGINAEIADLKYEEISISSFGITDTVLASGEKESNVLVELGAVVDAVTFAWKFSKTPSAVTFGGEAAAVDSDGITKTDLALTGYKSWTLTATDEREATAKKSAAINFKNGVYYGVLADGATLDSAAILSLSRKLQSVKDLTFTVTADDTQRIAYALPTDGYGTPTFKDMETTFPADMYLAETIAFTNASGHTENYDIWLSTNVGLGTITVAVS